MPANPSILNQTPTQGEHKIKYPLRGSNARQIVGDDYLTSYERNEIGEFEEIWFLAPSANKY